MPRYRTTLRPAGGGGLPWGLKWTYAELPSDAFDLHARLPHMPVSRYRYGVVETDRELTPDELRHFDIEPVPEVIVHILHHGLPLCRFSTAVPRDWPEGHRWTGLDAAGDATCRECCELGGQL